MHARCKHKMHTFRFYLCNIISSNVRIKDLHAIHYAENISYHTYHIQSNTVFHHVNPGQQSGQILHLILQERSDMLRGNGVLAWATETKKLTSAGSTVVRKTFDVYSYCVFTSYSSLPTCMCNMCFALMHCLYSAFSGGFELVDPFFRNL